MPRPNRCLRLLVPALVLAALSACTPFATYPSVGGGATLSPGIYPVPQVMAKSLRTTFDKTAGSIEATDGGPTLVFALPEGISEGTWRQVGRDIELESARAMTAGDDAADTPVWAIEQVRVRDGRAEVDVIFPVKSGYERATVILESAPFQPYVVKYFQRWRVPVDAPIFQGGGEAVEEASDDAIEVDGVEIEVDEAETTDDATSAEAADAGTPVESDDSDA